MPVEYVACDFYHAYLLPREVFLAMTVNAHLFVRCLLNLLLRKDSYSVFNPLFVNRTD